MSLCNHAEPALADAADADDLLWKIRTILHALKLAFGAVWGPTW